TGITWLDLLDHRQDHGGRALFGRLRKGGGGEQGKGKNGGKVTHENLSAQAWGADRISAGAGADTVLIDGKRVAPGNVVATQAHLAADKAARARIGPQRHTAGRPLRGAGALLADLGGAFGVHRLRLAGGEGERQKCKRDQAHRVLLNTPAPWARWW